MGRKKFKFGERVTLHNEVYDSHISGILIDSSSEEFVRPTDYHYGTDPNARWCLRGGTHTLLLDNGHRFRNEGYLEVPEQVYEEADN